MDGDMISMFLSSCMTIRPVTPADYLRSTHPTAPKRNPRSHRPRCGGRAW